MKVKYMTKREILKLLKSGQRMADPSLPFYYQYNPSRNCVTAFGKTDGKPMIDTVEPGQLSDHSKPYNAPILTDEEREYLSAAVAPYLGKAACVTKYGASFPENAPRTTHERLVISMKNLLNPVFLPFFPIGTKYGGMGLGYHYTLEELGL